MRRVDRWIGLPACAALTLLRKCLGTRDATEPRPSIVFVKLAEQGSTVLAWPAIRNAIQRVGRERVYFVAFEENRALLDVVDWLPSENILTIPTDSLLSVAGGAIRVARQLRRLGVDAAIDLEFFARSSAILVYLSGARRRVGFHSYAGEASYRGDLFTHRLSFNPYLHTSQTFESLVNALDHPPAAFPTYDASSPQPPALPMFQPSPEDLVEIRRIVGSTGVIGSPLLLLNANASDLVPLRRWPSERYVELAGRLLAKYPCCSIAFTGGPGEAQAIEPLVRKVGSARCVSVAGKTSFRHLLALYSIADLLVTNDSGPAHFAALTAIEVVTLFGPETPLLFSALTPRSHAIWARIPCSPCLNAFNNRLSSCTNNVCMQRITVDQVFDEAVRALESRKGRLVSEAESWARGGGAGKFGEM